MQLECLFAILTRLFSYEIFHYVVMVAEPEAKDGDAVFISPILFFFLMTCFTCGGSHLFVYYFVVSKLSDDVYR